MCIRRRRRKKREGKRQLYNLTETLIGSTGSLLCYLLERIYKLELASFSTFPWLGYGF